MKEEWQAGHLKGLTFVSMRAPKINTAGKLIPAWRQSEYGLTCHYMSFEMLCSSKLLATVGAENHLLLTEHEVAISERWLGLKNFWDERLVA